MQNKAPQKNTTKKNQTKRQDGFLLVSQSINPKTSSPGKSLPALSRRHHCRWVHLESPSLRPIDGPLLLQLHPRLDGRVACLGLGGGFGSFVAPKRVLVSGCSTFCRAKNSKKTAKHMETTPPTACLPFGLSHVGFLLVWNLTCRRSSLPRTQGCPLVSCWFQRLETHWAKGISFVLLLFWRPILLFHMESKFQRKAAILRIPLLSATPSFNKQGDPS